MPRFKVKPIVLVAIASCGVIAGAVALFLSKAPAAEKTVASATTAARPALTVTTTQAQMGALPIRLAANGNVAAWQEASIGTESNGLRLAEVRVNVGDVVQRGELLARFATEGVQADVAQARAGVAEATANAAEATANADRVRTLQNTGTFSGQQINQYLTAEQTAKARVASSHAVLAAQQLRLHYTQVLAPDSGVISARGATVGAVLSNGTELFRLIRQGRLEWRAEVTSAELSRIQPGTQVMVTAASGATLLGRVRMVAPTVDAQTRVGLVYVDLPTARSTVQIQTKSTPSASAVPEGVSGGAMSSGFKAGMFARGEFELGSSQALTVPQQAVVVRDGFSYAFRLNPDQRVSQIKLQTGRRVGERIEVLEGVTADTVLVASGAGFLNDGDLVKVVASGPAAAPATPASSTGNQPPALVQPAQPAIN